MRCLSGWIVVAGLLHLGCNQQKPLTAEQKLVEAQKQLEEAKKEVAAAEADVRTSAGAAVDSAKEPVVPGAAPREPVASAIAPKETPAVIASPKTIEPKAIVPRPGVPQAPAEPKEITIPAGTPLAIRTTSSLSTKTQKNGEPFAGSLAKDLVVGGKTLARQGAEVTGVVVSSDPGGRVKGRASLSVAVRSIAGVNGPIAVKSSSYTAVAKSTVKRDAIRTGIMAGAGAAIGAIAGGGKGAAIGAGAGGAAGAGTTIATRGEPAQIPAESVLNLKTTTAVTVPTSR